MLLFLCKCLSAISYLTKKKKKKAVLIACFHYQNPWYRMVR